MSSDCSGAPKRLVEELGGTSAGEALRARFPILKRLRDDGYGVGGGPEPEPVSRRARRIEN